MRRLVTRAALAALVAIAAACSSAQTSSAPVRTTSVELPKSYLFAPGNIVVQAGDRVTWTNHDNFTHSVQFLDGGLPSEPMVMDTGGGQAAFTFAGAGTFHYQCSFHPTNMKGTVTVEP